MTKSTASTEKQEETDAIQALLQLQCVAVQDDFITELKRRREVMSKKVDNLFIIMPRSRRSRDQCRVGEFVYQKMELYKLENAIEEYEKAMRSRNR